MSSILKVDTIQDQSGNNIINESGNVITIGASGDTITVPAGATVSGFTSAGIDDNATSTAITISSDEDVTFTEDILLGDNKKAKFGTGNDLEIYHTGTQSVISDVGSGNLNLEGDAKIVLRSSGGSENYAQFFKDGAVELYYDNVKKFETTSAGATITGTAKVSSASSGVTPNTNADELFVEGSGNSGITIGSGTSSAGQLCFGDSGDNDVGAIAYLHDVNAMRFSVNGGERGRFDTNGNLLLGATSVQGGTANTLQIADGSSARLLLQNTGGGRTYGFFAGTDGKLGLYDYSASAQRLAVDTSGNLLMGKTSSNTGVAGLELRATNQAVLTRSGGQPLILNRLTDDGRIIHFKKDNVGVGDINVSGTGISIQLGGTGTANELSDYEEGTWTPSYTGSTTGSVSYGSRGGTYTKIGNLVTAYFSLVNFTTTGSWAGDLKITGLPFASNQTNNCRVCNGVCRFYNINTNTNTRFNVTMDVDSGQSYLIFLQSGDDTNWESIQVETTSTSYLEGTITYRTDS